jgi:hypothetical protein
MNRDRIDDSQQYIRDFFLDNPGASIDAAAREAEKCHRALHKTEISKIRQEVRMQIERSSKQVHSQIPGYVVRRRGISQPFNTIRIAVPQSDPEAGMTADEVAAKEVAAKPVLVPAVEAVVPKPPRPQVPMDEKSKFLWEYAEKHPETSPKELNKVLLARFGSGFYLPTVSEALKYARAVVGMPITRRPSKAGAPKVAKPPVAKPQAALAAPAATTTSASLDDAVLAVARSLKGERLLGSLTIKLEADGTYSWSGDLRRSTGGSAKV